MEERIDELGSEDHKAREVGLESIVDIIVFIGRNFKVLFKLAWS
jgi:hypothetical protein